MKDQKQILIATKNAGKIIELENLMKDLPYVLRSLNEFPEIPDTEETGTTFAENAILKAREYAMQTNLWAVADDSGLEVAALGNAPGVFSARYAATNEEGIARVLDEMGETQDRRARFVCVMDE